MKVEAFIQILALMQGAFVFGISIVIMFYYLTRVQRFSDLQLHLIFVILSYMGLTLGTMRSIFEEKYVFGDIWFYLVGTAYILGDFSLIFVWRRQMRLRKEGKIGLK